MLLEAVGIALGIVFMIALIIAIFAFGLLSVIVYYLGLALAVFFALCIVSWIVRWIWTGKFLY